MDELTTRAMRAAVEVAAGLGLRGVEPELLKDGSNVLVHLKPSPVVARVATTTAWVRQPVELWLGRDLEVAAYLHSVGAPVVPPSAELPPGPHLWSPDTRSAALRDSDKGPSEGAAGGQLALTFWTYVEHQRAVEVPPEEAIVQLQELHAALRGFPGNLPYMGVVLDEIPRWLKWLEVRRRLSGQDLIDLREAHWKLAARLRPARGATQPLHGDAHRRNLLRTPAGLLWTDFEDTCKGPVAWDIATFLHQEPGREEELFALYPDAPPWSELQPYREARDLEAVVFLQVLGSRFPERAAEATRLLEAWQRRRVY